MYYITDYIADPDIESGILGPPLDKTDLAKAKAILVWHQTIDSKYLDLFPDLLGVVRYGVGFDNVDLNEIRNRNLVFCNTPDYGVDEVSDTTVAMILNISRGVTRYDFFCRNYEDGSWQENTISSLARNCKMRIGVIGAGRIGGSVLRKIGAVGYQTLFYDPYVVAGYEKLICSRRMQHEVELLNKSDIVSIHTPLTKETWGMVNPAFIEQIRPGASLVITARGEIIQSLDVIYDALKSDHLSNVALDVLPSEPPDRNHPLIRAWTNRDPWLDGRLLINPHSSYYSQQAYNEMRVLTAYNAKRIIDGEEPINIISDGRT